MNLYIRYIFCVELVLRIKFILSYLFREKIFYYTLCYCKGQIENKKNYTNKTYFTFVNMNSYTLHLQVEH